MSDLGEPGGVNVGVPSLAVGRWWGYQRERFPLMAHAPLVAAFSFCAVAVSTRLRGAEDISIASAVVAFVTCLLIFLQLRIVDEFKDLEEDARFRPYRPVPRGLVSLRELAVAFVLAALIQLGLAFWIDARLVLLLLVVWVYLALMTREFGAGQYLKARPLLYLVSHMLIMPLVDLYATGTDWLRAGQGVPPGLTWFLAASFFNGMSIDVGRKIRSPADEETGVRTYSVLWGRSAALTFWWLLLLASAVCAVGTALRLGFARELTVLYVGLIGIGGWVAVDFQRHAVPGRGTRIEAMTYVWTLGLYLGLGAAPLILEFAT